MVVRRAVFDAGQVLSMSMYLERDQKIGQFQLLRRGQKQPNRAPRSISEISINSGSLTQAIHDGLLLIGVRVPS